MITKDELRTIPTLHRRIEAGRQHLTYLREKATSVPSSLNGNPDRVQTSIDNNAGAYVEAAIDYATELRELEADLQELQDEATEYIESLTSRDGQRVLTHRYIECLGWDAIADLMGYTVRHAHRLEVEAVAALE